MLYIELKTLGLMKSKGLKQRFKEETERNRHYRSNDGMIQLNPAHLEDEDLAAMADVLDPKKSLHKSVLALQRARSGDNSGKVPSLGAFETLLRSFLDEDAQDYWVYKRGPDNHLVASLVTGIRFKKARDKDDRDSVEMRMTHFGPSGASETWSAHETSILWGGSDVIHKPVGDCLLAKGWMRETPELRAEYDHAMRYMVKHVAKGFAKQYVCTGKVREQDRWDSSVRGDLNGRKVIMDLPVKVFALRPAGTDALDETVRPVPFHPHIRVFDLKAHEFYAVHTMSLTPYEYDKGLRDKLILPETHTDLLDVMTTELDAFLGDIIEGKAAGNVVLCKGVAGIGKTLTAEIYSELTEKPLYAIHSGSLGLRADEIRKNLDIIFERQKRWDCVLLLDEADVFVRARGNDIQQNAIVAEFLRVMEYFDGLMFMTSNLADDIDEAMLSRCAAVIRYELPEGDDRNKIWRVLLNNFGQEKVTDAFIAECVETFPKIPPRDIKMLLRLALRMAAAHEKELDMGTLVRCAMFRDVLIKAT